jgi:hypothetical protein
MQLELRTSSTFAERQSSLTIQRFELSSCNGLLITVNRLKIVNALCWSNRSLLVFRIRFLRFEVLLKMLLSQS